jgi:hypothetical protein
MIHSITAFKNSPLVMPKADPLLAEEGCYGKAIMGCVTMKDRRN